MILIDFNQTLISSLMSQIGSNPNSNISEDLIRHMVLCTILSYKKKFSGEYGKLVFCADGRHYWRKSAFQYYKANRKKYRDSSKFDWNLIFSTLNKIRDEVRDIFPYMVIHVDAAEADDIIGTLARYSQENELTGDGLVKVPQKVLIISGDKDFLQLQKYENVVQYSPLVKRFLKTDDPKKFLTEHILKGDSGDGVPNFLSNDAVFVTQFARQRPIRKTKLDEWLSFKTPEEFCDDIMLRNYKRNEMLIDLEFTPGDIQSKIIEIYESGKTGDTKKMLNYFVDNGLKYLIDSVSEF